MNALALYLVLAAQEGVGTLPVPAKTAHPILRGHPTDYPLSALRKHEEGDVAFQMLVDATGQPVGCRVVSSSGYPDLDRQTCVDVQQMIVRFEPAQDANGTAIKSVYSSTIQWRLPK